MERAAKKEAVEQLNEVFKTTSVAIVAQYSGLTVAQMQKLRMQMKQAGASVKALASLPSLDELRGKLVGLIVAPATKLAQLSNAPAAKLARVIQAHASKGEAA